MKKKIALTFIGLIGLSGFVATSWSETEEDFPQTAVVTLDGQPLFQVRGMAGYSAEKRAAAIQSRIEATAENPTISTEDITVANLADRSNLLAGNTILASVLDSDAEAERLSRPVLAEAARLNIARGIVRYRQDRSPSVLFRRTVMAAGATLVLLAFIIAFNRIYKRVINAAERYVKARFLSLEARSSNIIESRPLWTMVVGLLNFVQVVTIGGAVYFYLNLVLGLYPWTRPLAAQLFLLFINPLRTLGHRLLGSVPNLAFLVILFFVVKYFLKVTYMFFKGIADETFKFDNFEQDWAWPTYRIIRILIICFAVVVAYPYIPGSNSEAFKGVSLFIGVIFSLGSTSFIANTIAGIALTYRRAYRVGDIIKVDDVMGLVTDMRLQTTQLRTLHNEVIVIPNSVPLNSHVINYTTMSKTKGLILHTTVGIGYQTPWRQVEAMLLMAVERTPKIKKESKPFIRELKLDTFYVQYELSVYCDTPLDMPWIYSDLHRNILDVFNEYGVQIMVPAYEGDPEQPKVVPKDKAFAPPANGSIS